MQRIRRPGYLLNWVREGLLVRHEHKLNHQGHYKKNKANISVSMNFGVDLISDKNWFHKLSFKGLLMNDSHIDVILYYLLKKAKYNVGSSFKYTTVDVCLGPRLHRFGTSMLI